MKKKAKKTQTQTTLAKYLGVTQGRVSQLHRHEEWRWGKNPGREKFPEIKRWCKTIREANNFTAGAEDAEIIASDTPESALEALKLNPFRMAQIRVLIERAATLKQRRELEAGGWIKSEQVDRDTVAKIHAVKNKMRELVPRSEEFIGKTAADCRRIMESMMREVCDNFSGPNAAA